MSTVNFLSDRLSSALSVMLCNRLIFSASLLTGTKHPAVPTNHRLILTKLDITTAKSDAKKPKQQYSQMHKINQMKLMPA